MVALLFALALIALTLIVLVVAGVVAAVGTGLAALNVLAVILGAVVRQRRSPPGEAWPEAPPAVAATHPITGRRTKALPESPEVSHQRRRHAAAASRRVQ